MISLIITSVAGILSGMGGALIFFPQVRKSKILENEARQSEEWRKLYEEERRRAMEERQRWDEERCQLLDKIDDLYKKITAHRDEKVEIRQQNTDLEVENMRLRMLKCETAHCPNRKPPTGY